MGVNNSKSPDVGVPLNPRVGYAGGLARKEGQQKLIDAPVLVQLNEGTVRYRYTLEEAENALNAQKNISSIERPHEGCSNIGNKQGYFYHATLNDFSEEAAYNKEEDWKFLYVTSGPKSALQKRLYYVYGRGRPTADPHARIDGPNFPKKEARPTGQGYNWPSIFKQQNHAYYDMTFLMQSEELDVADDELDDVAMTAGNSEGGQNAIQLSMKTGDRVQKLKKRLSVRLVKPPSHIHIYSSGLELHAGEVMSELRDEEEGNWNCFKIMLHPK